MFHEALLYSSLKSGVCRCELCSRGCVILPFVGSERRSVPTLQKENIGFCGTRINVRGKLYAVNYGRVTSLSADPVEKKPLYHFLPGESLLSFGSFGCNFRCPNCHNWEISQTASLIHNRPELITSIAESFPEISPAEVVSQAVECGCPGIAYTYNEPTVFAEFTLEVMRLARKAKLKNVWVSNGFFSERAFELISPLVDAFNIDLKSFDPRFYQSHCKGGLAPVASNLQRIKKAGIHLEITTLLIPGLTDKENVLREMAAFIARKLSRDVPWHLIGFSAPISWQMREWKSSGKEELEKAYEVGKEEELRFVYASGLKGRSDTCCPNCGELNIKRLGYEVENLSEKGTCFKCGQKLSIIM